MRTLYLHIGQSKTGSSYLQACLANGHAALAEAGIDYFRGDEGQARDWEISSGNGHHLLTGPVEDLAPAHDKVLFSAEQFFPQIATSRPLREKLRAYCDAHGIGAVRMLLFLRNPVAHAESSFQQEVKRGGYTHGVDKAFSMYRAPEQAARLLTEDLGLPDCRFSVFNYDKHRKDLLPILEQFLELPPETLHSPERRDVNRSMTEAERVIQQAMNAEMGPPAFFLSDALCHGLPGIRSERAFPAVEVQQAMLDRLAPAIDAVNAAAPPGEGYERDITEPADHGEMLTISRAQLDLIGHTLGYRLVKEAGKVAHLNLRLKRRNIEEMLDRGEIEKARKVLTQAAEDERLMGVYGVEGDQAEAIKRKMRQLRRRAGMD